MEERADGWRNAIAASLLIKDKKNMPAQHRPRQPELLPAIYHQRDADGGGRGGTVAGAGGSGLAAPVAATSCPVNQQLNWAGRDKARWVRRSEEWEDVRDMFLRWRAWPHWPMRVTFHPRG